MKSSRSPGGSKVPVEYHFLLQDQPTTQHGDGVILSQRFLYSPPHVFIDYVGDADGRDDFQEVGGDAAVEAGHALLGHNVLEQT